jgi:dihydrofolate reductase
MPLKDAPRGEIQVHGSCGLLQTLIERDLIDEYRLRTFPVLLGSGKRLFDAGTMPADLELIGQHDLMVKTGPRTCR